LRRAAARLPDLFVPGSRLVVGFSGGQDSTCLLHALVHSQQKLNVIAAHVDHGLRAESSADAERVAALAKSFGVEAEIQRVDVAAYREALPGWSLQQAARAARYHALADIAQQHAAAAVLVAHTADDQAETLLINLIRGAGLAGLAGMRLDETIELSKLGPPLGAHSSNIHPDRLRLARPLLRVSRSTTQAYCAELGLSIVEDPSNQSRAYTRNRVRLDLLPALERFNPAIRAVLARTADLAAEDIVALEAVVSELHAKLLRAERQDVLEYDLHLWCVQPRALQRRLLRHGLEALLGGLVDVRAAPVEDALDILASGTPARTYHLPYGVELCTGADTFELRRYGRARPRARPRAPRNTWGVEDPRV
jgi:tRNA(Ile)-lysidine synthetase-like protein